MKRQIVFSLAMMLGAGAIHAQWMENGNAGLNQNSNFVGTTDNDGLSFRTDSIQRMRLFKTQSSAINGFTGVQQNGYLGISPQPLFFSSSVGPFSRLHLADSINDNPTNFAQQLGFRPWMRNGITMTGNADQCYVGQKFNGNDKTDLVFQWSDNAQQSGPYSPDYLRFVFTSNYVSTDATGARSLEGLEGLRLFPNSNQSIFVGIGDWYKATVDSGGVHVNPRERLDLLDRTIRIRQLIPDYNNDTLSRVVMVDSTGRLHWRRLNSFISSDCDWVVQTPEPHVSSVYNGGACDWNEKHGVGVGLIVPKMKLHVRHVNDALLSPTAVFGESYFDVPQAPGVAVQGVHGRASSTLLTGPLMQQRAYGVMGESFGSRSTVGVFGFADITAASEGQATETYGVMGLALANGNTDHCVGVFGRASGATDPMDDWAGWFEGNVNIQGGDLYINEVFQLSDAGLKTNIQDATSLLGVISSLQPKSYQFNAEAVQGMNLPEGDRVGLIAQEVEEVLPELVQEVRVPAKYDTLGTMVQEAHTYKTVNYVALIPYLIGAVQELSAQNAIMQEQLAACCANPTVPADGKAMGSEEETLQGDARSLLIQPNPFNEQTTLSYTLERSGRAQLLVNSADGKQLKALYEAVQEAGQYQYTWNTGDLVPGVYYVTLLLDGEPLVKKAVKVAR